MWWMWCPGRCLNRLSGDAVRCAMCGRVTLRPGYVSGGAVIGPTCAREAGLTGAGAVLAGGHVGRVRRSAIDALTPDLFADEQRPGAAFIAPNQADVD